MYKTMRSKILLVQIHKLHEQSLKLKPCMHTYQPPLPGHTGSGSRLQACSKRSKATEQERVEDKISIYFSLT